MQKYEEKVANFLELVKHSSYEKFKKDIITTGRVAAIRSNIRLFDILRKEGLDMTNPEFAYLYTHDLEQVAHEMFCLVCGNRNAVINKKNRFYAETCCKSCAAIIFNSKRKEPVVVNDNLNKAKTIYYDMKETGKLQYESAVSGIKLSFTAQADFDKWYDESRASQFNELVTHDIYTAFSKMITETGKFSSRLYRENKTAATEELLHKCHDSLYNFAYLVRGKLSAIPKCLECGGDIKEFWQGYKFCSNECANHSPIKEELRKQACLEKYGVDNPALISGVQKKIEDTNMQRYGVRRVAQNKEIREKINQTNLDRYGSISTLSSTAVRNKAMHTNMERYGVEYAMQNEDIKIRRNNTCLEKYGVENPLSLTEVRDKGKQSNIERYGVENAIQSKDIIKKRDEANIEKYGYSNVGMVPEIRERINQTNQERYGGNAPIVSKEVYERIIETKRMNQTFNTSQPEEDAYVMLCKKFDDVVRQYYNRYRYPYNCDFYIPDEDIFIELNYHWTHGNEPYDKNNPVHQEVLKTMNERAETSDYYYSAVYTWTVRDVEKLNCAKRNNLNYIMFYNEHDFEDWLENYDTRN